MPLEFTTSYLEDSLALFRHYKKLAERAIAQVRDDELTVAIDEEANSISTVVKHMAGNMRSRWTDFLSTDGEKPDRNRDQEFLMTPDTTRQQLLQWWEQNWQLLFDTINSLHPDDLERTVTIRGQEHSVLQALNRAVSHCAYHTGQIAFLAKHWKGAEWKSLSVPKGQSEQFNAQMLQKYKKV